MRDTGYDDWGMPAFGRDSACVREMACVLLTAVEVVIGIGIVRLGPKRTIAYLLLVMQLSLLGSLMFYQLCIA